MYNNPRNNNASVRDKHLGGEVVAVAKCKKYRIYCFVSQCNYYTNTTLSQRSVNELSSKNTLV